MPQSVDKILKALVEKLTPVVRDAFFAAIADVSDTTILADLVKAIEAGDYTKAFQTLGMSNASMRPLTSALENAFEQGGIAVGSTFPKVLQTNAGTRAVFRFDVRNPRAEKWLADQSSSLVTRIQEDTRVNVRNLLTRGMIDGTNPRTTALDIIGRFNNATGKREGGIIGLTQQQELWVANARRDLVNLDPRYLTRLRRDARFDSTVENAIATDTPLAQETIDKLISRYKDSLLQLRGETVARTESIQALNRADYEALSQAVDMGAANKGDVTRIWNTAGDDRVRDSHADMDGQEVGLDEPFVSGEGNQMMFPGDTSLGADASDTINCRCKVRTRIDWLSGID